MWLSIDAIIIGCLFLMSWGIQAGCVKRLFIPAVTDSPSDAIS
jgi:hypothetical protein